MSSNETVAKDTRQDEALPLTQAAYLPGRAYDEMIAHGGAVRPHYEVLQDRIASLGAEELGERQRTLERSFLLQGITFTVYGADSATERIIPTDLFPRIIPAEEWAKIEQGLTQRLRALNIFLGDIYGEQKILMDGVVPRDLVLGAASYRRDMQHIYVPHSAYANVCG
ncbi:MAG TPA: circularly permuted type 2 ATP-grasp protein, partial [Caulobacteraceae bacterium]|nr:circularly permuted type 2 ATP-grasp protein [Caulobacteraceae bacterium]